MLTSDGLTRQQFMPMWRDQMWEHVKVSDRARLCLELGRLDVRDKGQAPPVLIAYVEHLDTPFVLLSLRETPSVLKDPAAHAALREQLADLGATEYYLVATMRVGQRDGADTFLLTAWGETLEGERSAWVMPFRWVGEGRLEQAEPMMAPDPNLTVMAQEVTGLLTPRH